MSRPTLKVKWGDKPIAHEAKSIVDAWVKIKQMSCHLPRAICLYNMLLNKQYDQFFDCLMTWFSPEVYHYFNKRTGVVEQPINKVAITEPLKPISKAVVSVVELSASEIVNNMANSLGIEID